MAESAPEPTPGPALPPRPPHPIEARALKPAERASRAEVSKGVTALADGQYGVASHAQLRACGISASAIDRWAASGRLRRLHPGVFAVGHAVLVPDGRRLAAVLACGDLAVLSDDDGGAVWGLCRSSGSRFHVTVPPGGVAGGLRPGIHVHVRALRPEEATVHEGIPITSVARTLLDLAARSTDEQVAEAVDQAIVLGLYDQRAIDATGGRGRAGLARLRKVIAARHPQSHASKSGWERTMLPLLQAHGLPRPEVNGWVDGGRISPDLLWRDRMLAVEWDSWTHHRTRGQFEADHAKTLRLQALGYTVLRFTWRHTQDAPETVVAAIRRHL